MGEIICKTISLLNFSLNYQYTTNKKNRLNGLPPLHPNLPSSVNTYKKKFINKIQGIAFLKKIK